VKITIENLNKVYPNGNHALKDVNLEINNGMFGLLGPNGAGKSSLMRILVTLMQPSSGKVMVNDYDLTRDRQQIRAMLGYLPQDFRFFSHLKTYEFLDYAARLAGMKNNRERKLAVDKMLEEVGLFEARDRQANKLSGGMNPKLSSLTSQPPASTPKNASASVICFPPFQRKMSSSFFRPTL
jgi:ABC-type multidrug transport system ATPase subunit